MAGEPEYRSGEDGVGSNLRQSWWLRRPRYWVPAQRAWRTALNQHRRHEQDPTRQTVLFSCKNSFCENKVSHQQLLTTWMLIDKSLQIVSKHSVNRSHPRPTLWDTQWANVQNFADYTSLSIRISSTISLNRAEINEQVVLSRLVMEETQAH